jgi:deoxycytidylate deaminase
MIKPKEEVVSESTCQKRVTMCEIFDSAGNLLARESNRCSPSGGICHRIGVTNTKQDYPRESYCNWTHAEINAINALNTLDNPHKAILYGHTFLCDNCEAALKAAGIKEIIIIEQL